MTQDYSLPQHFEDKDPVVTAIYIRLLASLRQFGDVRESPKKTSIHLDRKHGFAGVYTRKHYLNLHFRTRTKIDSPRIEKVEPLSAARFVHTVRLEAPEQVDTELMDWLRQAYNLAG